MNLIVVADSKWGIGRNNGLLFRLKKDMQFFKQTTSGKVIVVGANTFASFPKGALPDRVNIVLDSRGNNHDGAVTVKTVEELKKAIEQYDTNDVFICGGASVYKLMLDSCSTAFVTKVTADGDAQVFFPDLDKLPNWKLTEQSEEIADGDYVIRFCKYVNTSLI